MIIPNIWENKKWQPNHQPATLGLKLAWSHQKGAQSHPKFIHEISTNEHSQNGVAFTTQKTDEALLCGFKLPHLGRGGVEQQIWGDLSWGCTAHHLWDKIILHVCIYIHTYTHIHMYVYVYNMYLCMCIHVCIYIYICACVMLSYVYICYLIHIDSFIQTNWMGVSEHGPWYTHQMTV